MLQGINDLFDLFANGFKETKFKEGVNRSFISTGCLPLYNTDSTVFDFVPYTQQKTCGTMKIIPTGIRNHIDINLTMWTGPGNTGRELGSGEQWIYYSYRGITKVTIKTVMWMS